MGEVNDIGLLREYARNHSEAAFAELVNRHMGLVYSVALRFTGNCHHAEEIAQAVFIVLARKAGYLRPGTVLSGWLYQTARLTAANYRKRELRRHRREQEAYMQSGLNEPEGLAWEQIAPHLDEAMGRLGEIERNAVVLRFFANKTAREVGLALNLSEGAAHQRVNRALEKLRKMFARRGVVLSAALLAGALSTHAVQAAPAGLAAQLTAAAAGGAAVAGAGIGLAQATLKAMTWAQYKYAVGLGAVVLATGGALLLRRPATSQPLAPAPGPVVVSSATSQTQTPEAEPREPFSETMKFNLDTPIGGLAVRPDGSILVGATLGGFFVDPQSGMVGYYSRGAMCLKPDGALERNFFCDVGRPRVSDAMRARVEGLADGRVFVCGYFDQVDGKPRPSYALLRPDGRVDDAFEPWRGSTNLPGRQYYPEGVHPAAWLSDGTVGVATSAFLSPWQIKPMTVYRLGPNGKLLSPPAELLAGEFSRPSGLIQTLGPVGFWTRRPIAWSNAAPATARPPIRYGSTLLTGTDTPPVGDLPFEQWTEAPTAAHAAKVLQALFDEVPIEMCRYAARLPDGRVILAVCDRVINGALHRPGRFMRFDRDWKPDFTFQAEFDVHIQGSLTMKLQPDGKLLVAGIGTLNGERLNGLARLNSDGTLDTTFHCATGDSLADRIMDLVVLPDGRIVIGGFFSKVNGTECAHIARLNPDGSLDSTFRTPFLTLEQFNQERFRHRSVPVEQLARAAAGPNVSTGTVANPGQVVTTAYAPQTVLITALNMEQDVAVLHFSGNAAQVYILQARDRLNAGEWSNVATNQAAANAAGVFRDTDARNHATRFYRIATP